jgi:hypothetical protein
METSLEMHWLPNRRMSALHITGQRLIFTADVMPSQDRIVVMSRSYVNKNKSYFELSGMDR